MNTHLDTSLNTKSDNKLEATLGNKFDTKKIGKDIEAAAGVSATALALGAVAVAGLGYLLWTNRSKIMNFVKDQDLGGSLGNIGEKVTEAVKPVQHVLHYASDTSEPKSYAAK